MKVLEINACYYQGSTGTIVSDLQSICKKNEIDCHVAYAISSRKQVPSGYKIGCLILRKIHALLSRIDGKQAYFSYVETFLLIRYMKRLMPDVVHLHNVHNNYLNLNSLLKFLAQSNIPTVVTLHDCWFHTGGCFHYTAVRCNRWLEGCGHCPKKLSDTPAFFRDKSAAIIADRQKLFQEIPNLYVVGVSKWILRDAQQVVFRNRPSTVIYNGVDLNIFKPRKSSFREEMGWNSKEVILGPASKWLDPLNKGALDFFLGHLSNNQILVLFGSRKDDQFLHPKLQIIKYISDKKLLTSIYSSANVMVNCSHEDSLSFINIEAQACGTPVVTYGGTGIEETVDSKCGFAVESGDYVSLYHVTMRVLKNRPSPKECREWVANRFNKDINYLHYLDVYKSFYVSSENRVCIDP